MPASRPVTRGFSEDSRQVRESETDLAQDMDIFDSPTFAIGSEIFWGNDRLEDALQ